MGKCSWVTFERGAKTALTFVFSHVGLCALVVGYSIAGAFLFTWLEQKAIKEPFNSTEHIERCIDDIISISEKYGVKFSNDMALWTREVIEILRNHSLGVAMAVQEERYDKSADDLEERWSIINSLFYCVTVITTIGYGHISPRTPHGRLVTIVYSLFGIPLMLLCLNNIGDSMATTFRFSYRRLFCMHRKQKPTEIIPHSLLEAQQQQQSQNQPKRTTINANQRSQQPHPKSSLYRPPPKYKPKRKNMLISPPISATIHRGSDLPPKPPSMGNEPLSKSATVHSSMSNFSTPSSAVVKRGSRSTAFSPNLSPCIQFDVEAIVAECAAYAGSPVPESATEQLVTSSRDYDPNIPSPSLTAASAPSREQSAPSSPLNRDAPSVWFTGRENGEPYLTVPNLADGPYSVQSTRPASPSSGWADMTSIMSVGSNGRPWTAHDSSASVTWATPITDDGESLPSQFYHQKRHAGKTLVVYNTLSGDALKQQTKIQRKMALHRAKHGHSRNEATTVFTDPVSGQPVNGDMLGLNYRPIELEPSDKDTRVPIILVLAFVISYLLIGAVLFSSLEAWYFLDSFYFCFITLSTIGFGDLVPGNLGFETREAQIKLVALALYLLLGLAVLAMSFSLVQEEVVLKCKAFAHYIGLKDE